MLVKFFNIYQKFDEQWNVHDWKNLFAIKGSNSKLELFELINHLCLFHHKVNTKDIGKGYQIYYKQYDYKNIRQLYKDAGNWMNGYKEDIQEYLNKGYKFIYFTTQKSCYEPVQVGMEMLGNYLFNHFFEKDYIHGIVVNEKW